MQHTYFNSPAGLLKITSTEKGISEISFIREPVDSDGIPEKPTQLLKDCSDELEAWFRKELKMFSIPLDPKGTAFQLEVWRNLIDIPYGKTISYLHLANILGDRNKIRAVGGANSKNPIAIIIPCHRVIGSDGSLTGYAGGLEKKKWLLHFEGSIQPGLFE